MKQSGVIPKEFISLPGTPECFPLQIREVLSNRFFFSAKKSKLQDGTRVRRRLHDSTKLFPGSCRTRRVLSRIRKKTDPHRRCRKEQGAAALCQDNIIGLGAPQCLPVTGSGSPYILEHHAAPHQRPSSIATSSSLSPSPLPPLYQISISASGLHGDILLPFIRTIVVRLCRLLLLAAWSLFPFLTNTVFRLPLRTA